MKLQKLIADLRFVIGLFFVLVSVILVVAGSMADSAATSVSVEGIGNLDYFSAGIMGVFGVLMLSLAWRSMKKS